MIQHKLPDSLMAAVLHAESMGGEAEDVSMCAINHWHSYTLEQLVHSEVMCEHNGFSHRRAAKPVSKLHLKFQSRVQRSLTVVVLRHFAAASE